MTLYMALFFFNHTVLLRLYAVQADSVHGQSLSLFPLHLLFSTFCLHSLHHLVCASTPWFSLLFLHSFTSLYLPHCQFSPQHNPCFMNLMNAGCPPLLVILPFLLLLQSHCFPLYLSLWSAVCLWHSCNYSSCYYFQLPLSSFAL